LLIVQAGEGSPGGLDLAAKKIAEGEVIAIPTDTVYGLACDAFRREAVRRIYQIKGRSEEKPLVLFIGDVEQAKELAQVSEAIERLMRRLWPGPVTFVCQAGDTVPPWISLDGTVGLRIPKHQVAIDLVKRAGTALATTSANISGQPPSTTANEVSTALRGQIALAIDAGPAAGGSPSAIIDVTVAPPRILREGPRMQEIKRAILEFGPEAEK
jgi:L-threonylcarbamoyladenylate synthase